MTTDSLDRPAPGLRSDKVPLGILLMLAATVMFACSTAISKWQVTHYSFAEVLFFRSAVSLILCAVLVMPRTGIGVFRTRRIGQHFGRSITQTTAQSCILIALSMMPIAGAMAINFSAPLFATLFAAIWLKESIGLARGLALAVGFGGVLLVVAPGADSFTVGALFAVANAVLFGSVTVAVRGMTSTESPATLTVYQMGFMSLLFALAMPFFGFTMPTLADAGALVVMGCCNGFGQYWWTRSLSMAPASAVGPFYYFSLIWISVLGYVFWGEVPTPTLVLGAGIVVGSGLLLLWRESARKAQLKPDAV